MKYPDKHRLVTRGILITCNLAFMWITFMLTNWLISIDPTQYSDVQYAAMWTNVVALLGFFGKLVKDLYVDYTSKGNELKKLAPETSNDDTDQQQE